MGSTSSIVRSAVIALEEASARGATSGDIGELEILSLLTVWFKPLWSIITVSGKTLGALHGPRVRGSGLE